MAALILWMVSQQSGCIMIFSLIISMPEENDLAFMGGQDFWLPTRLQETFRSRAATWLGMFLTLALPCLYGWTVLYCGVGVLFTGLRHLLFKYNMFFPNSWIAIPRFLFHPCRCWHPSLEVVRSLQGRTSIFGTRRLERAWPATGQFVLRFLNFGREAHNQSRNISKLLTNSAQSTWLGLCLQDQIHGHFKALNDNYARERLDFGKNLFLRMPYFQLELGKSGQVRKQVSCEDCSSTAAWTTSLCCTALEGLCDAQLGVCALYTVTFIEWLAPSTMGIVFFIPAKVSKQWSPTGRNSQGRFLQRPGLPQGIWPNGLRRKLATFLSRSGMESLWTWMLQTFLSILGLLLQTNHRLKSWLPMGSRRDSGWFGRFRQRVQVNQLPFYQDLWFFHWRRDWATTFSTNLKVWKLRNPCAASSCLAGHRERSVRTWSENIPFFKMTAPVSSKQKSRRERLRTEFLVTLLVL